MEENNNENENVKEKEKENENENRNESVNANENENQNVNVNSNESDLKSQAKDAIKQAKEELKKTNVKEQTEGGKNLIKNLISSPIETMKEIINDEHNKYMVLALVIVVIWAISQGLREILDPICFTYYKFSFLGLIKAILSPVLKVFVMTGIIYTLNKGKIKIENKSIYEYINTSSNSKNTTCYIITFRIIVLYIKQSNIYNKSNKLSLNYNINNATILCSKRIIWGRR